MVATRGVGAESELVVQVVLPAEQPNESFDRQCGPMQDSYQKQEGGRMNWSMHPSAFGIRDPRAYFSAVKPPSTSKAVPVT